MKIRKEKFHWAIMQRELLEGEAISQWVIVAGFRDQGDADLFLKAAEMVYDLNALEFRAVPMP